MTINFTERKDALRASIADYNEAVKSNKASFIGIARKAVGKARDALYEQAVQDLCAEKKTAEHPLLEVLKVGEVETYVGKTDSKTGKMSMEPVMKPVDFNTAWEYFNDNAPRIYLSVARCLSSCIVTDTAKNLEIDVNEIRFKLSDELQALLSENADPTSIGSVQRILQHLIDEIVGKDALKIRRKAAAAFREWMTTKGREHGETAIKNGTMAVKYACDIIYCEANHIDYTVKSQVIATDKPAGKKAKKKDKVEAAAPEAPAETVA